MAGEVVNTGGTREMAENTRLALNTLREEFDAVEVEFDAVEAEHDALRSEFDTLEAEHDALRSEFDTVETEVDANTAGLAAVATQDTFSTDEADTGMTWVDAATIYRKAVAVANFPNATTGSVAHGITGLGTVIRIYGMADNGTNQFMVHGTDGVSTLSAYATDTNIEIAAGADLSGYSGYLVIEYTKSA